MKTVVLSISILLLLMSGCKDNGTNVPVDAAHIGNVALALASAPAGIVQVNARLTREGFGDRTLSLTIGDSNRTAAGSFTEIPIGTWHLKVDALDDSGKVEYSGETDVDVQPGQTSQVSLELLPTGGSIDIQVTWGNSCTPAPSGLVSWWRAEGDANDPVGANNGNLINNVTFPQGKVGKAFGFDGFTTLVRVPSSSSLNPTGSFTLETWIYPTKDTIAMIVSKWGFAYGWENQRTYALSLTTGGNLNFGIANDSLQEDQAFQDFKTVGGPVTLNAWTHVAAVYDHSSGARQIYVNGVKVAERDDAPITITRGIADLSIGAYQFAPYGTWNYFSGKIDEVSLYNRALSGSEINALYTAGSAGKCR